MLLQSKVFGVIAAFSILTTGLSALSDAQSIRFLEPIAGYRDTAGGSIADDGTIVSNYSRATSGAQVISGFLVRPDQSVFNFGLANRRYTYVLAGNISADGSTIPGAIAPGTSSISAALFNARTGAVTELGTLPGFETGVAGLTNHNGSVIVGSATRNSGINFNPFVTRNGGPLTQLPGIRSMDDMVQALGMSRDGSVIVGASGNFFFQDAVKWNASGEVELLQRPVGWTPDWFTAAIGVSSNASFAVGFVSVTQSMPALWDLNGSVTVFNDEIFVLARSAGATAISDDGTIMYGGLRFRGATGTVDRAFIRTPDGAAYLDEYYRSLGIVIPQGVTLTNVNWISPDGMTAIGSSFINGDQRTFIATIPSIATLAPFWSYVGFSLVSRRRSVRR